MVFPRKLLHLTISSKGEMALWDDRERALLGKNNGDVYVPLLLSLSQTDKLKQAQKEAGKEKK